MKPPSLKRVVVADDHPVVLHGLAALLNMQPDFKVVAACLDGDAALEAIREHVPEIALLDCKMPKRSGLEVLADVTEQGLPTKIVFLTATANDSHALAAITRRAHGLLLKDAAPDRLVECLRAVSAGRRWIPPEVIEAALRRENHRTAHLLPIVESLSPREREVMKLVADGLSNKEIAEHLDMAEGTVKIHLHSIYNKAGVHNRTSLAALAYRVEGDRD